MGQPVETLVLDVDGIQEALAVAMHAAADTSRFTIAVEDARDYPEQRLAVDVFAANVDDLAVGVARAREVLARRFGITGVPTANEIDWASARAAAG